MFMFRLKVKNFCTLSCRGNLMATINSGNEKAKKVRMIELIKNVQTEN